VAGQILAFSIPGAALWVAGMAVGYTGLVVLVGGDWRTWPLLTAVGVLFAWLAGGIVATIARG
jgi:hypothetical protein